MSTERKATRITLRHGRSKKSFIIPSGPIPEVGDAVTLNGQDWTVEKVKEERIFAEFSTEGGKLKQIFP